MEKFEKSGKCPTWDDAEQAESDQREEPKLREENDSSDDDGKPGRCSARSSRRE